jgi:hypothetical protein
VSYQPQPLVYSWNLKNKIEFWMLVWNARCEAEAITWKSHMQQTPKYQAFFLLLGVVIISSFGIGTEIPWEYF